MNAEPEAGEPQDRAMRAVSEAVGRRIKAIRVTHGHSQEMLGRVLGLTFQQVQKYERGSNKVSADKLWRIARHYGVPLEYFFQDIDPDRLVPSEEGGLRTPHERLRLEIGRVARRVPAGVLRAVLNVMRATGSPGEADDEPVES